MDEPVMPKVIFFEKPGVRKEVDAVLGQTLLEVARDHQVDIEGTCEGNLACATCHLIIDKQWFLKLPKPCEDEEDMLDLAYGLTASSRLGCQIKITGDLDGLIAHLPFSNQT